MQTFKLNVPIRVPEDILETLKGADAVDDGIFKVTLNLSFYGPKGNAFGQEIELPLHILDSYKAQELLFKKAMALAELGIASFDQAVEALKKFKNDENEAFQYLLDQQKKQ